MPHARHCQWRLLCCFGLCISNPALAQTAFSSPPFLWGAIGILLVLQTLLVISRHNNKRARIALGESQKQLEQQVYQRTNSLHHSNQQLHEEIRRHKTTESLLNETQHYLHSMLDAMPSVIIGVTHSGLITHWNLAAEKKTGIVSAGALGEHINDTYSNLAVDYQTIIDRVIATKTPFISQNIQEGLKENIQYSDLTLYPLLETKVKGVVIRIDDVTMRVRVENMMIQNEKMLSLGELAAGIAHEINNPLSIILHGIQNIHRRLSKDLPANLVTAQTAGISLEQINQYIAARQIPQILADIKAAGERSAAIVTNMLDFSHTADHLHQLFDLGHTIGYSLDLLATEREKMPNIELEIDDKLSKVYGSATEIQQVILNLVRNSAQALTANASKNAKIKIAAYECKEYVTITISDNGPGMTMETARHIFEPFFTTKGIGQGTGLGLSVSYFIITKHHGGTIEVQSTLGEGTCFYIKLPKH